MEELPDAATVLLGDIRDVAMVVEGILQPDPFCQLAAI